MVLDRKWRIKIGKIRLVILILFISKFSYSQQRLKNHYPETKSLVIQDLKPGKIKGVHSFSYTNYKYEFEVKSNKNKTILINPYTKDTLKLKTTYMRASNIHMKGVWDIYHYKKNGKDVFISLKSKEIINN